MHVKHQHKALCEAKKIESTTARQGAASQEEAHVKDQHKALREAEELPCKGARLRRNRLESVGDRGHRAYIQELSSPLNCRRCGAGAGGSFRTEGCRLHGPQLPAVGRRGRERALLHKLLHRHRISLITEKCGSCAARSGQAQRRRCQRKLLSAWKVVDCTARTLITLYTVCGAIHTAGRCGPSRLRTTSCLAGTPLRSVRSMYSGAHLKRQKRPGDTHVQPGDRCAARHSMRSRATRSGCHAHGNSAAGCRLVAVAWRVELTPEGARAPMPHRCAAL